MLREKMYYLSDYHVDMEQESFYLVSTDVPCPWLVIGLFIRSYMFSFIHSVDIYWLRNCYMEEHNNWERKENIGGK